MKAKSAQAKQKKNTAKTAVAGFKVVPAPRSPARRALLSAADIAASGGARTVHSHAVR
jgi:hypothetical protein